MKGFVLIRRETVLAYGSKVPHIRLPLGAQLSWFVGWYEGYLRLNFFLSLPPKQASCDAL